MKPGKLPPGAKPFLTLTAEETKKLQHTGRIHIDDPERGEIEIIMLFDEDHPGLEHKQLKVRVIRRGTAVQYRL
jgi:hypothetical protein